MAEGYDLSPQQRRLWLLGLRRGNETQPRARALVQVSGPVELGALRRACELVVARHEALRTTFYRRAGMRLPLQVVRAEASVGWVEESGVLDEGVGLQVQVQAEEGGYAVELSVPALCADAASLRNLVSELERCYEAAIGGTPLQDEAVSYIQFAEWQNDLLKSQEQDSLTGRAFWGKHEAGSVPVMTLPFEAKQRFSNKFELDSVTVNAGAALVALVGDQAQQRGSRVEDYLLACWVTLLWRLSGCEDVIVSERVSGRKYAELENAVGLFEKWLPVRATVEAEYRLHELLEQIAKIHRERRAWEDYFFSEDEAASAIGFDYEPLINSCSVNGVGFRIKELSACHEQFKLRLSCVRHDQGLQLTLHFDTGMYAVNDVRRMASSLLALIESTVQTPEATLSHLNLIDEEARAQLIAGFNQTSQLFAQDTLVYELFEEQAASTPDAVAVVCEDKALSYADLNARANQLARRLRSLGVGPESVVAIMLERSVEMCVALISVLKAGGAYLPIDPRFPRQRVAFMLEDTQASVLLTQSSLLEDIGTYGGHCICLDTDWHSVAEESAHPLPKLASDDNLVYVIFTSGSTGRPKGVAVEHRQLFNYVNSVRERLDLPIGGSYALVSTFAADLGHTALYPALCSGGELHIIGRDTAADAEGLAQYFSQHPIDCLKIVPSHFATLISVSKDPSIVPRSRLIFGGEAASRELAERAKKLAPHCQVMNHYGPTETTVGVLTCRADEESDQWSGMLPLGRPIANTQVYILDRLMQPAPMNVPGELYIGGAGLARGYLGRPELTAERFVPDPFSNVSGARLYRTGDMARRLENGVVEFLGRWDEQVKFHGYRVELGELRAALNRYPGVRDSVVVMRRDAGGRELLAAYYVARQEVPVGELRQYMLGEVLSEVVPQVFIHLRRLPLTLNGKVNFEALPDIDEALKSVGKEVSGPRGELAELVAGVWTEVLGVERVGVHDNFFELGGHSLLATQVVSRLREACGVELPLRTLFESPTVEGLSRWITSALNSGQARAVPSITRVSRSNAPLPLSFAQQRLWFLHQLEPESGAYNIFGTVRFDGHLNRSALELSLRELVRRHEAFCTTFAAVNGVSQQVIGPPPDLKLISEMVASEAEAGKLAAEEAQRPFDLEQGPVFRVRLLSLNENDHILFYTMHHIVSDAWSMGLIFKEVTALYQAFSRDAVSPLPELPIQYADYAVWQREWLKGEVLDEQVSYWRRQLAGAPPLTELPSDRPRPPEQSFRGAVETFSLSHELLQSLRKLSRQENVTPFMTLLACFATLLFRRTGQTDLVLGTDVANRTRPEVEDVIGFFINQLALRVDVSGDPNFLTLVRRVREVCLGAYAHQDLPFDRVVAEASGRRGTGQTPLFQVLFVVQNAPTASAELPDLSLTPLIYDSPTSKFDLGVFITETTSGLSCVWRYSTDLFEASTIQTLARQYETLLHNAVTRPEDRLSSLDILTLEDKEQQKLERQRREAEKIKRLTSRQRKVMTVAEISLVTTELLDEGEKLPLVVKPVDDELDLAEWVGSERLMVERLLLEHGALLFRGFGVRTAEKFERLATALCPELFAQYGDLPRAGISGKVYGSTPYPAEQAILFHNESSHLDRWPMKIMFCCLQAAQHGGETPIVDCRRVYSLLNPRLRERFEQKKLLYVRNYTDGLDVSWQRFFHTDTTTEVEEFCRRASIEWEWKNGDGLRTRQLRRAIARHPRTQEMIFFNQIQLHHVSCLDPEVRESIRTTFGEADLPRNVYFGDGSQIEDSVVEEISEAYRQAERAFAWQTGDVLMLDNMLVAHARRPYVGERKIVVAMGEMLGESDLAP